MSDDDERKHILDSVKTYIATNAEAGLTIKRELDQLLPGSSQEQILANAMSKLEISYPIKFPKYQKGDNFARFCEKFREHVILKKIKDPNLFMYFLQNVDDVSYATLKTVELTAEEKANADVFCTLFQNAIYGDQAVQLRNEVRDCKQEGTETIAEFAYKLREKANIAYTDPIMAEENCFMTFLRGIKNTSIRRKLNEATSLNDFNEAVKFAKQLESVESRFQDENESLGVRSILKAQESAVSFQTPDSEENQVLNEKKWDQNDSSSRSRRPNTVHNRNSQSPNNRRNRSASNSSYNRENSYSPFNGGRARSPTPYNGSRYQGNNRRGRRPTPARDTDNFRNNIRRDIVCWGCQKRGHTLRFCWNNPNRNRQQSQRNTNVTNRSWGRNDGQQNQRPRSHLN